MPFAVDATLKSINKDCEIRVDRNDVVKGRSSRLEILPLASSTYEYTTHLKMLLSLGERKRKKMGKGKETNTAAQ
jgi:hypothetical protein